MCLTIAQLGYVALQMNVCLTIARLGYDAPQNIDIGYSFNQVCDDI